MNILRKWVFKVGEKIINYRQWFEVTGKNCERCLLFAHDRLSLEFAHKKTGTPE